MRTAPPLRDLPRLVALALCLAACGDDGAGQSPDLREPGDSKAGQPPPAESFQMRNRSDYTIAYPVECAGNDFCRPLWLELQGLTLDDPCNCVCRNPLSCERPCPPGDGPEQRMLAPGAVVEFSWTGRHYEDMGNREPEGPRGMRCLDMLQLGTGDPIDVSFCWYPSRTLGDEDPELECETVRVDHMDGQLVTYDVTCEGDCAPPGPDAGPDPEPDGGMDAGI